MKNQFKTPKIINTNISSDMKQFLLTLLATTISIVLTFGTSAIIEKHQKKAAKKEMVMMIIYDFDKTKCGRKYGDYPHCVQQRPYLGY